MTFNKVIILLFFVFSVKCIYAQKLSFETQLPIVYLNTNGGYIVDEPRISAEMAIAWNENGDLNNTSDLPVHFKGDIKIEVRGSSSQMFPKKSYGFELKDSVGEDMDFPLLGMPEEEDWILYAPYTDKTLIRNVLTLTLADQISDKYAPRCKFVELFLNNEYEGVYVLMEKIKRDSVRVDIAKLKTDDLEGEELTGGYIVKVDKETGSGGDGWSSQFFNDKGSKTFYQYEYPKFDEIKIAQKNYIKNYIDNFESAVHSGKNYGEGNYLDFINEETFFDCVIINEISRNVDGYRLSTYLYKEKNGYLNAGPLWDYNLAYGNANYHNGWETHGLFVNSDLGDDYWQVPFWWKKMVNDPAFANPMKCRWQELRADRLSEARISTVLDSLVSLIHPAVERNYKRWPILGEWTWPNYYVGNDYYDEVSWMKDWMEERISSLDFAFPGICGEDPFIAPVEFELNVFPNPFSSKFVVQIYSKRNLSYTFRLFTVNGQKVLEEELSAVTGENNFSIGTNNFKNGVFIYRLTKGDSEIAVGKIVKM